MTSHRKKKAKREIYELRRSPFAQRLKKKGLANLLGRRLADLEGLVKYKSSFVIERDERINGKLRPLCYPISYLRGVNERIIVYLNRIKLPDYVYSPRKGISQKHNAIAHVGSRQILILDLRKFYPSIKRETIARFFREEFSMYTNVAGLLTELLTYNGRIFYGSPATPLLAMLAHRKMFDEIDRVCRKYGTTMTLWVDNLTISGQQVPGALLEEIRNIIAMNGGDYILDCTEWHTYLKPDRPVLN